MRKARPTIPQRIGAAWRALAGRSYDAAGGGRRWTAFPDQPNTGAAILQGRETVARRARYLVGSNALAAAAVEAWVSALIGPGIRTMSQHPNKRTRERLNAAFARWAEDADADGVLSYSGLQALAARRLVVDGEALALKVFDGGQLRIRLLDAQQLDSAQHRELSGGGRVIQGIEFDARGRRVAYWIFEENPAFGTVTLTPRRVLADQVLHLFRAETPGQVRGLSWFAPVLLRLAELDKLADAQVIRQQIAAMLAGFVISADGGNPFSGDADGTDQISGLEPGTLQILPPGMDVKFSDPAEIGGEAMDFVRIVQREIASGLGVPYEALTGDLSDVNYSSIRAGLVEFRRRAERIQKQVIFQQMMRPVWRAWIRTEALAGRARGDLARLEAADFFAPRQHWVDPQKDVAAEVAAIEAGLMSRREAVAARGRDLSALDAEIAADREAAAALGLNWGGQANAA